MGAALTAPAWLFPGQGAQKVGMGRDLYEAIPQAREIFERADAALDRPLSEIIFNGPVETLVQTVNAQPAIFTTSLACLAGARALNADLRAPPAFVAGHSLGEYTALVAAGSLAIEDGVRLVQRRGRLMQRAGEEQPGTLAAILGLGENEIEAVCLETGAEICNVNAPTQIVVGGSHPAVARAMDLARARGARRTLPLRVSAAFHSSLMQPAADTMKRELERVSLQQPQVPLVANVTGAVINSSDAVRTELAQQVGRAVRWRESVEFMLAAGVRTFVEIGPGTALTSLVKAAAKDLKLTLTLHNFNTIDSIRGGR